MPSTLAEGLDGLDEAGAFVARQINLGASPVMTALRIRAEPGEEHEHLLGGRVLRFVENDEGVVQRASAHVGERRDLDDAAFHVALDFLGFEHVVERVVERAQVGHDFFLQVAGQKSERLAGLDGGAGEDDAR